jgi:AcrR family transcriptional regulator
MHLYFRYQSVSWGVRNPDQTKEKILAQSGILFNRQGYKATSLSNITDATGLTKGAIYRHFASKEDLEQEALGHLSALMFDKLRACVRNQSTAGDKLRAVFRYFELYLTAPPVEGGCPLLNAAIEADDTHPGLRKAALGMLQVLRDSVVHILRKGIEHEQIKPGTDVGVYATLIIASLEGALMMSKLSGDDTPLRQVAKYLEGQIQLMET